MKKWYKTLIISSTSQIHPSLDRTFEEHKTAMAGYTCDGYASKELFFNTYFANSRRHICYDGFLSQHLPPKRYCLSIASGRAVNELRLMEQGRNILCSDLEAVCFKETLKLFPRYRFVKWDCLNDPPLDDRFECAMSLSLIYLLDYERLRVFFRRVHDALIPGGVFLLDAAGAPDRFLTKLLHDYWLPLEARLARPLFSSYWRLMGRGSAKVLIKHHGFLYTNQEILEIATAAGFRLEALAEMDFETEWERSFAYEHLFKRIAPLRWIFLHLGPKIPYVRMLALRRE